MIILTLAKRFPLVTYFTLAFGVAWLGILGVVWPTGIPGKVEQVGGLLPLVLLAMIAGPVTASLTTTALVEGRAGLRGLLARFCRWRVGARWYAVALLTTPLALLAVLLPLSLVAPVFT